MEKVEEGYLEELELLDIAANAEKGAKREASEDEEEIVAKVPKI